MSAISDLLNSAFSELIYDKKNGKTEEKAETPVDEGKLKKNETIRETIEEPGSLAEFDRVLGMLESNDPNIKSRGMVELDKMSDENRLACVAIFSKNPQARSAAISKLKKKAALLEVVFSESLFTDSSESALSELASMIDDLSDQKALVTVACNHRDRRIRMKALSSVKEVKWLIDAAYASRYEDTRWEAIERLSDMHVDIDKEDLRQDDTLTVLADQLVKSSISAEEIIADMQVILENVRFLENIARSRKNYGFSDNTKDTLESYQKALRSIAMFSRHKQARDMALKGMEEDPAQLAEVAQHSEYEDTASMAVDMLLVNSKAEPQALALVAAMSNNSDKRSRAVARLQSAQMLKHVVKFSKYEDSRIAAA